MEETAALVVLVGAVIGLFPLAVGGTIAIAVEKGWL